jgi:hypothetical protein
VHFRETKKFGGFNKAKLLLAQASIMFYMVQKSYGGLYLPCEYGADNATGVGHQPVVVAEQTASPRTPTRHILCSASHLLFKSFVRRLFCPYWIIFLGRAFFAILESPTCDQIWKLWHTDWLFDGRIWQLASQSRCIGFSFLGFIHLSVPIEKKLFKKA